MTGKPSEMMPDLDFGDLTAVAAVAAAVPLLLGLLPWLRVPSAVLEIVAGVVIGPSVLDVVHVDTVVSVLALLGLGFLLFLAGLEIDLGLLRGRVLVLAVVGYGLSLAIGTGFGLALQGVGWVGSGLLVGVALSATSLGLVVPVLRDARDVGTAVGTLVIAASTVADFAAVIVLSLLFSSGDSRGATVVMLVVIGVAAVAVAAAATRAGRSRILATTLSRLQDGTAEIRVRLAVLLFLVFVALAARFGLETILGAFLAGAVLSAVDRDGASHPAFRLKLDAIGYGFLIPIFFVASGIRLDLQGLLEDPWAIARVPVFLAALLLARGLPALLYRSQLANRATLAAGLLQATSLPFIVAATAIGVELGRMSAVTATAMVCAGLISVVAFPVTALALLPAGGDRSAAPAPAPAGS